MSTIWDLLSRKLMRRYEGTGEGSNRMHLVVTGFWASSRALRTVLRSIRSLLLSFYNVQEAVRVAVIGGAEIVRVSARYAGGVRYPRPKGKFIPGSGAAASRKGGVTSRRGTVPSTVILSLSAAGRVAKAACAYSGAISKLLPSDFVPHQIGTAVPLAVEGKKAKPLKEKRVGNYMPAPSAGTAIVEGLSQAAGRALPQKETDEGTGKKFSQISASRSVSLSSGFLATAALLGTQATVALSGAAGSVINGWSPRSLSLEWKAAGAEPAGDAEPTIAPLTPEGMQPLRRIESSETQLIHDGRGGMAGIAEGIATAGTGIRMSTVALTKKQLLRSSTLTGSEKIDGKVRMLTDAGGMAPARTPEGKGVRLGYGLEVKFQKERAETEGAAFFPFAEAFERTEFRKAAGIWKIIFGAVPPALFALQTTMELGLPLPKRILSPTVQGAPSSQVGDGQVIAPPVSPTGILLGYGTRAAWKNMHLTALNLATLVEEVRSSMIAPESAISRGEEARSGISEGYEAATERRPVPIELEATQLYPLRGEATVNVDGDEDLLELQRKISRILEDEMRRHYGEG